MIATRKVSTPIGRVSFHYRYTWQRNYSIVTSFTKWFRPLATTPITVEVKLPFAKVKEDPKWLSKELAFRECSQFLQTYTEFSLSQKTVSKANARYLSVQSSSVMNSGNGVFSRKLFQRGEIVSFYPGVYYPSLPQWLISLPDGSITTDLRPQNAPGVFEDVYKIHSSLGGFLEAKYSRTSNVALAHIINHPPKGILPNTVSYCFFWEELLQWMRDHNNVDDHTIQLIRSEILPLVSQIAEQEPWYIDPNTEEIVYLEKNSAPLVGIVFLASRTITIDEELFYDYRFKPGKDLPSWYHPVPENDEP